MLRRATFGLFSAALCLGAVACNYEPLNLSVNIPALEDAIAQHDVIAYGENRFLVGEYGDDGFVEACRVVSDLQGWYDPELNDGSCANCTEVITLVLTDSSDTSCDEGFVGSFSIGVTPTENFPEGFHNAFHDWVLEGEVDEGEGTAVAFLQTLWSPLGAEEWEPRMGVFEDVDPVGLSYEREYYAQSYFYYVVQDREGPHVRWNLDLKLTE